MAFLRTGRPKKRDFKRWDGNLIADWPRWLVVAARLQHREDHQIGMREKPLFGFGAGGFRGPRDRAQVLVLRELAQMVGADAREGDHFVFGEDFLAHLDSHHRRPPACWMLQTN